MLLDLLSLVQPAPVPIPSPGGGAGVPIGWTTRAGPRSILRIPIIAKIRPTSVKALSAGFTLTVEGARFVRTSVVQLDGSSRATTFVSNARLQAAITAADLRMPGRRVVSVATPGVGMSNPATLTIESNRRSRSVLELILLDEI